MRKQYYTFSGWVYREKNWWNELRYKAFIWLNRYVTRAAGEWRISFKRNGKIRLIIIDK